MDRMRPHTGVYGSACCEDSWQSVTGCCSSVAGEFVLCGHPGCGANVVVDFLSPSSRLFQARCLRTRRGALFLITLLSKLAILGLSTGTGRSPSGVFFSANKAFSMSSFAPAPPLLPRPTTLTTAAGVFSSPPPLGPSCPRRCYDSSPHVRNLSMVLNRPLTHL